MYGKTWVGRSGLNLFYRNDLKFSDRYAWANCANPDQTAPRGAVWSGSTLFAIPSASFGLIILWQSHIVQIFEWLQQIFWVSKYFGNLRYFFFNSTQMHILAVIIFHYCVYKETRKLQILIACENFFFLHFWCPTISFFFGFWSIFWKI